MKVIILQGSTGHVLFTNSDSSPFSGSSPISHVLSLCSPPVSEHSLLALSFGADSLGIADEGSFDFAQALSKFIHASDGLPSKVSTETTESSFRVYADSQRDLLCLVAFYHDNSDFLGTSRCRSLFDQVSARILVEVSQLHDAMCNPEPKHGSLGMHPGVTQASEDATLISPHSTIGSSRAATTALTARGMGVELAALTSNSLRVSARVQGGAVQWHRRVRVRFSQFIGQQTRWLLSEFLDDLALRLQHLAFGTHHTLEFLIKATTSNSADSSNYTHKESFRITPTIFGTVLGFARFSTSESLDPAQGTDSQKSNSVQVSVPSSSSRVTQNLDEVLTAARETMMMAIKLQQCFSAAAVIAHEPRIADEQRKPPTSSSEELDRCEVLSPHKLQPEGGSETFVVALPTLKAMIYCFPGILCSPLGKCWLGIPIKTDTVLRPPDQAQVLAQLRYFERTFLILTLTAACVEHSE